MVNQSTRDAWGAVPKFPKIKGIGSKIVVKANLFNTPPLKILAQEPHQSTTDRSVFHALPQLFWTLENKSGAIPRFYGQNVPYTVASLTLRRQLDALLDDMSDMGIRVVMATAREIADIEQGLSAKTENA